jgi:hypothetical protein
MAKTHKGNQMKRLSLEKTKLTELGLSSQSLRWLVDAVWRARLESKPEEEKTAHWDSLAKLHWGTARYRSKYVEMAAAISVKEALSAWEEVCKEESRQKGRRLSFGYRGNTSMSNLVKLLLSLGVTKQEMGVVMESGPHVLRLSKEEWLVQPIFSLDTLSGIAIRLLNDMDNPPTTVEDLLKADPEGREGPMHYLKGCMVGMTNTRNKLKEIGFVYEDGPFMQWGTKRRLVEKVMKGCGIDKDKASLVVDSACIMKWSGINWQWEE